MQQIKVMRKYLVLILIYYSTIGFGQSPTFSNNFEDQNTTPEIGSDNVLLETGTSGRFAVSANPHSDTQNSSNYCLLVATEPGTGGRAEHTAGRYETNEKTYIYTWKRYHATTMFADITITGWMNVNQWKTWPCEYYGSGVYEFTDSICYGGGIFNEMLYEEPEVIEYVSRAKPYCNVDYYNLPKGYWNEFVLEIYWTETTDGYYRIWRNDTLFGYSDHIKTLFDGFIEGTCDMNWSTGLYTYWDKIGAESQDELIAYIDDIAIYDADSGYTITSICSDCDVAPTVPTDSIVYRVNMNYHKGSDEGFTNYIVSYSNDTSAFNLSSTFGQSNGVDIYLPSVAESIGNNTLDDECYPANVIRTSVSWSAAGAYPIYLEDLNPDHTYTFRLLGATTSAGATRGTQIWTTEENRDTVLAASNLCNLAELTDLTSDENGNMTINVAIIGGTAYINSIELVEYAAGGEPDPDPEPQGRGDYKMFIPASGDKMYYYNGKPITQ